MTAAIAGALAVIIGAFVPFVSFTGLVGLIQPDIPLKFKGILAGFGLVLLALVLLARRPAAPRAVAWLTQLAAALGIVGYIGLAVVGHRGVNEPVFSGLSITVTFAPGIGMILSAAGCLAVIASAYRRARR